MGQPLEARGSGATRELSQHVTRLGEDVRSGDDPLEPPEQSGERVEVVGDEPVSQAGEPPDQAAIVTADEEEQEEVRIN